MCKQPLLWTKRSNWTNCSWWNLFILNEINKRRIPLKLLSKVTMSKLPDNFFSLHVEGEYDYLLVSPKKIEIVQRLIDVYESLQHEELSLVFADAFEYNVDSETVREIHFSRVEGGISTQIYTKQNKRKA